MQRDIYNNTVLLVELCVTKLDKDWFVLLELLALVFNPQSRQAQAFHYTCNICTFFCRWHSYNANVPPEMGGKVCEEGRS